MIRNYFTKQKGFSFKAFIILFVLNSLFSSCSEDVIEPIQKDELYNLEKPNGFPDITFDITGNPVTINGVALGKKLFMKVNFLEITQFLADFAIFRNMLLRIMVIP